MGSLFPMVSFDHCDKSKANALLEEWGHYLGECRRPFGRQDFALCLDGMPLAIATSASTVSAKCGGMDRTSVVELARLVRHPDHPWVTRVALRLWREVGAPAWLHWPVAAAVAYSANDRHEGRIYRFDGWERVHVGKRRATGGGTWTKKRDKSDPSTSPKTLWRWRYQ